MGTSLTSLNGRQVAPSLDPSHALHPPPKWVMACVRDCLATHDNCMFVPEAAPPARIVEIWGSSPNIYCSDNFCEAYVCLSHCWGSSLPLKTTKANLAEFQKSIDFDLLPKTFQDAVSFVQRLGIGYLWIDALCIVQDDLLQLQDLLMATLDASVKRRRKRQALRLYLSGVCICGNELYILTSSAAG